MKKMVSMDLLFHWLSNGVRNYVLAGRPQSTENHSFPNSDSQLPGHLSD